MAYRYSYIVSKQLEVTIHCGGCEKEFTTTDATLIPSQGCRCGPDNWSCMCETGTRVEAQCPHCKYYCSCYGGVDY